MLAYVNNKWFLRVLAHLLFWVAFVLVSLFVFSDYYWKANPFLQYALLLIAIVYFNTLVLQPYLIAKKWYAVYTILFFAIAVSATQLYCQVFAQCGCSIMKCLSDYLWQTLVPLIFFGFLGMIYRYIDSQESMQKLEQKHQEMELQLLRSQINPHMLLNTLNTIYAYSLEKPKESSDLILMLSDNLKHILYNNQSPLVSLEDELHFIDNYIVFQKIRTEGIKQIYYTKTTDQSNYQIVPLLLITIIENAFKHSRIGSNIQIDIAAKASRLYCSCSNDMALDSKEDDHQKIGLRNLKKRLELLYKESYLLRIEKKDPFVVQLEIPLA
ncbi:MAG: histidine kinase [Flavobacteriaceae bacterium]|nr:histidine kinase [Flavobacteriaceae bacterium]